ncbi:MAG TPA: hypothetical protein VMF60_10205 [Acidimicrobiales bacterium]|nr:hypothetical protein [Acidimicrobiales bacterium]
MARQVKEGHEPPPGEGRRRPSVSISPTTKNPTRLGFSSLREVLAPEAPPLVADPAPDRRIPGAAPL